MQNLVDMLGGKRVFNFWGSQSARNEPFLLLIGFSGGATLSSVWLHDATSFRRHYDRAERRTNGFELSRFIAKIKTDHRFRYAHSLVRLSEEASHAMEGSNGLVRWIPNRVLIVESEGVA